MLWIKSLHIVFIVSWFSGLFYLPRIFVNLAKEGEESTVIERLLLMARRLYRFMTLLMIPALGFGLWLWLGYGVGRGDNGTFAAGWLYAKLAIVIGVIGYHHACGSLLRKFENGLNRRSEVWYRWFNEMPVLLLLAAVILVVVKPF